MFLNMYEHLSRQSLGQERSFYYNLTLHYEMYFTEIGQVTVTKTYFKPYSMFISLIVYFGLYHQRITQCAPEWRNGTVLTLSPRGGEFKSGCCRSQPWPGALESKLCLCSVSLRVRSEQTALSYERVTLPPGGPRLSSM